jgi:DinB superfamily
MATPIEVPDAAGAPLQYRDALLALVGDRDPLDILADTPDAVAALCTGATAGRAPAAGEWSAADVVGHLVDVEVVFSFRWRLALTADEPTYPGYDEKRWAALPRPPLEELVTTLQHLRTHDLHLLRQLGAEELGRVGVHGEQGPETVDVMVRKMAGHDLAHLDQSGASRPGLRPWLRGSCLQLGAHQGDQRPHPRGVRRRVRRHRPGAPEPRLLARQRVPVRPRVADQHQQVAERRPDLG